MPETSSLLVFITAAFLLLITPGPAVLYIVARSIDQGRWAGIVSAIGVGIGTLVHVCAAALGLSALLLSSALAFSIVKYLGAAYLIYLGVQKLRTRTDTYAVQTVQVQTLQRVFFQGIIVNTLNPKIALFFFAFLPQFVDPARGNIGLHIALLGMIFVVMGICTDSVYATLAGTFGGWLKQNRGFLFAQKYITGSIYILLGLTTAVAGSHSKSS